MAYRSVGLAGVFWLWCGSLMPAVADRIDDYLKAQMAAVLTNQQHLMPYLAMGVADLYHAGPKAVLSPTPPEKRAGRQP